MLHAVIQMIVVAGAWVVSCEAGLLFSDLEAGTCLVERCILYEMGAGGVTS